MHSGKGLPLNPSPPNSLIVSFGALYTSDSHTLTVNPKVWEPRKRGGEQGVQGEPMGKQDLKAWRR